MSYALDANILLYASDTGSPHHVAAQECLRRCVAGPETVYLPWPVLMAYLRIATHPTIFAAPLTPAEAQRNVSALLSRPHIRPLSADDGFWLAWQDLAAHVVARGRLVTDLWIAAVLRQHGVTRILTNDNDFKRFGFLSVVNPL